MPTKDKPIWNTALINNGKMEQAYELAIVRHGHWETKRNPMMYQTQPYVHVCSECGTAFPYKMPYCGECGAKMDEVEDGS